MGRWLKKPVKSSNNETCMWKKKQKRINTTGAVVKIILIKRWTNHLLWKIRSHSYTLDTVVMDTPWPQIKFFNFEMWLKVEIHVGHVLLKTGGHPLCLTQPHRLDIITGCHTAPNMSTIQSTVQTWRQCAQNIALHVHLSVHIDAKSGYSDTCFNIHLSIQARMHLCAPPSIYCFDSVKPRLSIARDQRVHCNPAYTHTHTHTHTASRMTLMSLGHHNSVAALEVTVHVWLWKWLSVCELRRITIVSV